MPTYLIRNKKTGETTEQFMSISAKEELLKNDINLEQVFTTPIVISGVSSKPDSGFRDILKSIKTRNPGSNINTF